MLERRQRQERLGKGKYGKSFGKYDKSKNNEYAKGSEKGKEEG